MRNMTSGYSTAATGLTRQTGNHQDDIASSWQAQLVHECCTRQSGKSSCTLQKEGCAHAAVRRFKVKFLSPLIVPAYSSAGHSPAGHSSTRSDVARHGFLHNGNTAQFPCTSRWCRRSPWTVAGDSSAADWRSRGRCSSRVGHGCELFTSLQTFWSPWAKGHKPPRDPKTDCPCSSPAGSARYCFRGHGRRTLHQLQSSRTCIANVNRREPWGPSPDRYCKQTNKQHTNSATATSYSSGTARTSHKAPTRPAAPAQQSNTARSPAHSLAWTRRALRKGPAPQLLAAKHARSPRASRPSQPHLTSLISHVAAAPQADA